MLAGSGSRSYVEGGLDQEGEAVLDRISRDSGLSVHFRSTVPQRPTCAVKGDTVPFPLRGRDGDSDGDRVTERHRMMKAQGLAEINGSGTWEFRA